MGSPYQMRYGNDQDQFPIDLTRPVVPVPGGMGTEYQMTEQIGPRWVNFPSVWGGQVLEPQDAYRRALEAIAAGGWVFPNYGTLEEAERGAQQRSETIGKLRKMR